jgi:hypothetical protein
VQWGSACVVFRAYIRTMLVQHAYDLDHPIFHRNVQRGPAVFDPRIDVCTMLKQ